MNLMKVFLASCVIVAVLVKLASTNGEAKPLPQQEMPKVVSSVSSVPKNQNPYDMEPWASERLATPISLPNCPWVTVIEWRAPAGTTRGGPSEVARKVLGNTCEKAVQAFPKYLKIHKLNVVVDPQKFHQSLCLMPALDAEGSKMRNLNDSVFRFKDREKSYGEFGRVDIIWGYTNFHNNSTYMRNDVINEDGSINKKTVTIFAHELYHAMSWQYQVNNLYYNDAKTEEEMALNFTQYLGLGR